MDEDKHPEKDTVTKSESKQTSNDAVDVSLQWSANGRAAKVLTPQVRFGIIFETASEDDQVEILAYLLLGLRNNKFKNKETAPECPNETTPSE